MTFTAEKQAEQNDLIEIILIDFLVARWFHFEEFNPLKHLLHSLVAVVVKLQHLSDELLIHDLRDDFVPLVQLDHLTLALILQIVDYLIEWFLNFPHALSELVLYLIEPAEYTDKAWSWLDNLLRLWTWLHAAI